MGLNDYRPHRRAFLRDMAGVGLALTATGTMLSGCTRQGPGLLDIASETLRREGSIVRLRLGGGSPGLIMIGSTSTADENVAITVASTGHRVALGASEHVSDGAFIHAATLSHNQVVGVWAKALSTGEPGSEADVLLVTTPHGEFLLHVWIQPVQGEWRPRPSEAFPDAGIVAVHAALMRRGSVSEILAFSPPRVRDHNGHGQRDEQGHEMWDLAALHDVEIRSIDPASFASRERPQDLGRTVNLFCVGQAHMPSGRLLTAGGHISLKSITDPSANFLHIYNPVTGTWARSTARLKHHRWYPTVTALPDGRMLITSGSSQAFIGTGIDFFVGVGFYAHLENNYEIYDPVADEMVDLGVVDASLIDLRGEETFTVPVAAPPFVAVVHKRPLATYPAVFVVPGNGTNGVLLMQEANRGWLYKYQSDARPPLIRANTKYEMPGTGSRSYPHYGSAVLLNFADGSSDFKLLVLGGAHESRDNHTEHPDEAPATASAIVFDYNQSQPLDNQPGWRRVGSMLNPRVLCDATLLPDGQVLVTGGVSKGWTNQSYVRWAVRGAELFDPATESFRQAAMAQLDRRYHSTALLLQDGTVAKMGSTGGFAAGAGESHEAWISSHTEVEVYHPPYAWYPRPTAIINGGQRGEIELGYGAEANALITGYGVTHCRIVLMKAGAVTHGLNMDQRSVTLRITQHPEPENTGEGTQRTLVRFLGPSDATVAPPGPYLLFVLDDWGVPSQGYWRTVG